MALIKNSELLTNIPPTDLEKLEKAAEDQKQVNRISFKIVEITDQKIIIQVAQGKNSKENYYDRKGLIEITHQIFDQFFPDLKVLVHPIPYTKPKHDAVNHKWLNKRMKETSTKLQQLVIDTGIDYETLTHYLSGIMGLPKPEKALFYYYFLVKENQIDLNS